MFENIQLRELNNPTLNKETSIVQETEFSTDKDTTIKIRVREEIPCEVEVPRELLEEKITDKAQKYETERVNYLKEEILSCREETSKFLSDKARKHRRKALKRRENLINDVAEKMQNFQDEKINLVAGELQQYRKETLNHIKMTALHQVEEAMNQSGGKIQMETFEALSYLIQNQLNPIIRDTQRRVVDALNNIVQGKGVEIMKVLHDKIQKEDKNKFDSDQMITAEAQHTVGQETGRYFEDKLKHLDEWLTMSVKELEENLQVDTSRRRTEVMEHFEEGIKLTRTNVVHELQKSEAEVDKRLGEEMLKTVNRLGNRIIEEVQKSKNDAVSFLENEARDHQAETVKQIWKVAKKYVRDVQEHYKLGLERIKNLLEQAKKSGQEVLEGVLENVV